MTLDGDSVFLRATIGIDPAANQLKGHSEKVIFQNANGGRGYDWARSTVKIVEPCLRPSTSTPPWEKVLAYELAREDKE